MFSFSCYWTRPFKYCNLSRIPLYIYPLSCFCVWPSFCYAVSLKYLMFCQNKPFERYFLSIPLPISNFLLAICIALVLYLAFGMFTTWKILLHRFYPSAFFMLQRCGWKLAILSPCPMWSPVFLVLIYFTELKCIIATSSHQIQQCPTFNSVDHVCCPFWLGWMLFPSIISLYNIMLQGLEINYRIHYSFGQSPLYVFFYLLWFLNQVSFLIVGIL